MAASRIKGITIKIGGDTTDLQKSLQSTNKNISDTQSQLKDVERLLKLDPKNTELLSQKQKLLGQAVGETREKLDKLKTASEQAAKSAGKYEEFKKVFDPIQKEIGETDKALRDLKKQQEAMGERTPANTEAYDKIQKEIEETDRKLKDLKKHQKAVADEFGNPISPESYDALQREIAETEIKLENLTDQSENFGSVAAQQAAIVGQAFAEAGEKISGAGEKMMKVTGTVVAGATAAVMTADGIDKAADQYMSATGTAEYSTITLTTGVEVHISNSEAIKDQISDIFSEGYGESLEDVSGVMASITTVMGQMDAEKLQQITENAITFRDTFGADVNEQMLAVNSLMDQFGLTSEQAYSLMVQGAQKGLNQNGDLLDVITEYSVQFRTAGYSAEDMFNMLQNGVNAGTWSVDKLGDAVKEFNIRMSDGSAQEAVEALGFSWESVSAAWSRGGDDAREVFNMLISELDGLENTTEGYSLGVALLGTMYEDLGHDAVLALSDVSGGINASSSAMDELKQKRLDNLSSQLENLGRKVMTDVAAPLGEQLIPKISEVIDKVSEWIDKFSELSPEGQNVILTIAGIVAGIGPLLIMIGSVVSGVGKITGAIGNVMQALPQLQTTFSNVFGFIKAHPILMLLTAIILFGDQIQEILQKVDDFLQGVFAKDWTEVFGDELGGVLNGFFMTLKGVWDSVKLILDGIIDFVRGVFTGDWERAWLGISELFEGIFGGLLAIAAVPINGIIGLINGLISGVNLAIDALNDLFGLNLNHWDLIELFDPNSVIGAIDAAQGGTGGGTSGGASSSMGGATGSRALPMLANGGIVYSGSAIVGDAGPELLTVANGRAVVQPLTNQTNNNTHLGGVNIVVNAAPGQDAYAVADIVMDRIQTTYMRTEAAL